MPDNYEVYYLGAADSPMFLQQWLQGLLDDNLELVCFSEGWWVFRKIYPLTVPENDARTSYGDLSDAEIEELGAQEAERKEFCPNCEAETPCTHEAELFVCDICGEDFAKYIVSRNCNVSDVSMTQDVTTPEPTEGA